MPRNPDRRGPRLQFFFAGEQQILLPEGVTLADWALERNAIQNPRIRAYLGSIRLLETVLESNYAILHCSPQRLTEIWRHVYQVCEVIRRQLSPLLAVPSKIPSLELARGSAEAALELLDVNVLAELRKYEGPLEEPRVLELRKALCISIGKIHAFLQDTFGELMAADPRSQHDADYYLSKRFPQDIEEAEWLHVTVERLLDALADFETGRATVLAPAIAGMARESRLPAGEAWDDLASFLGRVVDELTPKLKEVLALRGIRFDELEILDRYAAEIPTACHTVLALGRVAREATALLRAGGGDRPGGGESATSEAAATQAALSTEALRSLRAVDHHLRDLFAFAPLWLDGIRKRRALLLKRGGREGAEES